MLKARYTSRIVSAAASTNPTLAKASAGTLHNIHGYNTSATAKYLKLYNQATAPTVGTDIPIITIAIPPTAAFAIDYPNTYFFTRGIAYALTGAAADADTTALVAGDVVGLNVNFSE